MFRIASFQFGCAMFAASVPGPRAPQWSDRVDEAHTYDHRDSRTTKLTYWKALAQINGLDPAKVQIVEVA